MSEKKGVGDVLGDALKGLTGRRSTRRIDRGGWPGAYGTGQRLN